jgi:invasion protein IalB
LVAAAAISTFATPLLAQTQDATPKSQTFGNWVSVCDRPPEGASPAGSPCYARLTVRDQKSNATLLTWTVGFNKEGSPLMEVVSPIGVFLEPGVSVAFVPGDTVKLPYVSCGNEGCMSRIEIDKGLLQALKAANKATISVSATNGNRISFGIQMTGSAKAISSLGF